MVSVISKKEFEMKRNTKNEKLYQIKGWSLNFAQKQEPIFDKILKNQPLTHEKGCQKVGLRSRAEVQKLWS